MDESWRRRIHIGLPTTPQANHHHHPPRRSVEDYSSCRQYPDDVLSPEDFADVFGGPPRTIILARHLSGGFWRSSSSSPGFFYEDIFRPPGNVIPARSGRSLPEFRIPGHKSASNPNRHGDFYDDIFGWENRTAESSRSRTRSKTSSSLSSEDLSPLRPVIYEDGFGGIASNRRPINVKSSWNSRKVDHLYHRRPHNPMPTSPGTISLEPISSSSFRVSADDLELHFPSSSVYSVFHSSDREEKDRRLEEVTMRQDNPMEEEEYTSSYVIEINSDNRDGTCESNGVDEAIAWAKEKFQTHSGETNKQSLQEYQTEKNTQCSGWTFFVDAPTAVVNIHTHAPADVLKGYQVAEGNSEGFGSGAGQGVKWDVEEDIQLQETLADREVQMLDEKISVWSSGKETDILLLLSSLHQILWPNSGWVATPLSSIVESSKLKKAYQRARLCLHPDKLQQRGATLAQKYIAEKAFTILQDAWSTFISRGVL